MTCVNNYAFRGDGNGDCRCLLDSCWNAVLGKLPGFPFSRVNWQELINYDNWDVWLQTDFQLLRKFCSAVEGKEIVCYGAAGKHLDFSKFYKLSRIHVEEKERRRERYREFTK